MRSTLQVKFLNISLAFVIILLCVQSENFCIVLRDQNVDNVNNAIGVFDAYALQLPEKKKQQFNQFSIT